MNEFNYLILRIAQEASKQKERKRVKQNNNISLINYVFRRFSYINKYIGNKISLQMMYLKLIF